jgi:hypothetical protein
MPQPSATPTGCRAALGTLDELLLDEPGLLLGRSPVFAALPLRAIGEQPASSRRRPALPPSRLAAQPRLSTSCRPAAGDELREVHSMHSAELEVKAAVVRGFEALLRELQPEAAEGAGGAGGPSGSGAVKQTRRTAEGGSAGGEERVRGTAAVYCTAWLLSPEVREERSEGALARLAADMRGF